MQKAPFANCDACPLKNQPCVQSHVPESATIIVVGEAPGASEILKGIPFVGQSGQLLERALLHVGIDSSQVGKTNAVLCRPNGNATPPIEAVLACSERLRATIESTPVQTIVACGNTAVEALDRLSDRNDMHGIMARRGQWYPYGKRRYLAAYHPAFILRQPNFINQFIDDLNKAVNGRTTDLDTDKIDYVVVNAANLNRSREYLNHIPAGALVSFDVETDHLQWFETSSTKRADFLCLALSYRDTQAMIIPAEFMPVLHDTLAELFDRCRMLGHNGKYDQHVLASHFGFTFPLEHDTMLMHYTIDEGKGHGLKELAAQYLGIEDYEGRLIDAVFGKTAKEKRRYSRIPKDQLYEYAAIDVCATLVLYRKLEKELKDQGLLDWPYTNVLIPVSNAIEKVERFGIRIDRAYLEQARIFVTNQIEALSDPINAIVKPLASAYLLDRPKHRQPKWCKSIDQYREAIRKCADEFNPNSWQQVQIVLYDILRLEHSTKLSYKTDPRSTNEEALLSLQPNDTTGFIDAVLQHRRLQKILGTYIEKLLYLADHEDRVHINYLLHGTEIGRLSATDAMHGIPRPGDDIYGAMIRGSFVAAPGKKLIVADYSQAELRAFAANSKEPTMLEAFNNNEDPHDQTARWIADSVQPYFKYHYLDATIPAGVKKEIRTLAKNVNFGEIYQGGASGISAMLHNKIPARIIQIVLDIKRKNQPVAAAWKLAQFRLARSQGYVQTRFGRKRRFPLITEQNLDEVRKACVHMPIASEASELTLLSIVQLTDAGIPVCGTWHDSIIAEVNEDQAEAAAELMEQVMVTMGERYIPDVPWKVDVAIVDRWCQADDVQPPSFDHRI